jgi:putative holliday junction resolvase
MTLLVIVSCILVIEPEVPISRILALDVGDARIGLALSDPLGILASPLKIITRQNHLKDVEDILDIAKKNDVSRLIIGLPVNMDGTLGGQAEKVKEFVNQLKQSTVLPIEFKDERLTTVQAKQYLSSSRKPSRNTRYDAAAAALILQSYLDDRLPPQELTENTPPQI